MLSTNDYLPRRLVASACSSLAAAAGGSFGVVRMKADLSAEALCVGGSTTNTVKERRSHGALRSQPSTICP